MKSYRNFQFISFLLINLLVPGISKACDICGCGSGNLYFGFLPNGDKHQINLRFRNLIFDSHLRPNDPYESLFRTREHFQILDLMGSFRIGGRFRVQAMLPYVWAEQTGAYGPKNQTGIADALTLVQYRLVDTDRNHPEKDWKHQLFTGAGLKVPVGDWKVGQNESQKVNNPNFQPGTGSWDYLFTWQYHLKFKNWGLWQDGQGRWNGENPERYRFGHRLTGNLNLMYQWQWSGKRSLMPMVGLYVEYGLRNEKKGYEISETGGQLLMQNLGFQASFGSANILFQYQIPIGQHLADGSMKTGNRLLFQLGLSF